MWVNLLLIVFFITVNFISKCTAANLIAKWAYPTIKGLFATNRYANLDTTVIGSMKLRNCYNENKIVYAAGVVVTGLMVIFSF